MKKIVGILGMAAVLASGAFAAEPAADFKVAEFTGSAEFGWTADFKDSDNVKMGMFNKTEANLKLNLVNGGTKATAGDGLWGEIGIKFENPLTWNFKSDSTQEQFKDLKYPVVETAKLHLVSGDITAALNILKPSLKYDAFAPFVATPLDAHTVYAKDGYATAEAIAKEIVAKSADYATLVKAVKDAEAELKKAENRLAGKSEDGTKDEAIDSADTKFVIEKRVAAAKTALATAKAALNGKVEGFKKPADDYNAYDDYMNGKIGDDTGLTAGFGLEFAMDKLFALNFKFMDDGISAADNKKFGLAFDVALKAIENLDAKVAASFNFDAEYTGLQATAAYKFAINDKLYVKPGVAYAMNKAKADKDAKHNITAGAMFGWGAVDCEPGLDFISNKTNEGASVAVNYYMPAENQSALLLNVGLYDESLFTLLGIDDFGKLKTGVQFTMANSANSKAETSNSINILAAAVKYDVELDPVYVALHGGMRMGMTSDKAKSTTTNATTSTEFKYGVKLGTKKVFDNTDLYVSYEGAYLSTLMDKSVDSDYAVRKSELTIGTKIAF